MRPGIASSAEQRLRKPAGGETPTRNLTVIGCAKANIRIDANVAPAVPRHVGKNHVPCEVMYQNTAIQCRASSTETESISQRHN